MSRTDTLYGLFKTRQPDDIVTYEEMSEALGRDVKRCRSAIYATDQRLQTQRHRALKVVKTVGYRIVKANEHVSLAEGRQRRCRRETGKSVGVLTNVVVNELTQKERQERDQLLAAVRDLYRMHNEIARSVNNLEHRVARLEDQPVPLTPEEVRELREMLVKRVEAGDGS